MPRVKPEIESFARIKVIGAGGSGNNVLDHMIRAKLKGIDFIAVNTDAQDLHNSLAPKKIFLGRNITKGLGAGMDPDLGRRAAEETAAEIAEAVKGADMVFVACGFGGGTGTGAGPVIANIARESGALTVGVVTKPFSFEGAERMRLAEEGLRELITSVDAMIVIPNDKLFEIIEKQTSFLEAFEMCDEILKQGVEGISDLITTPGIINVDFADVRTIMQNAGTALMGIGIGTGERRAADAAERAINSPLLDTAIDGARGVLFSIAGGPDLTMWEINEAARIITESIAKDARVIFGAMHSEKIKKGELKITVIATGFAHDLSKQGEKDSASFSLFSDKDGTGKVAVNTPVGTTQIDEEDTPTIPEANSETIPATRKNMDKEEGDESEWDAVPAFLRRRR